MTERADDIKRDDAPRPAVGARREPDTDAVVAELIIDVQGGDGADDLDTAALAAAESGRRVSDPAADPSAALAFDIPGGDDEDVDDGDVDEELVLSLDDDEDGAPIRARNGERVARRTTLPVPYSNRIPESLSALNLYLARLKDVVILPVEEQTALARRYQLDGDPESAARLVASNLRLVVKIAFQFRRQWADVMDLVAEGNVGLAEAIRKFDADRGVPFPSYARFWIRARILAFIQENKHLIHTGSRAARKLFWRLDRERRALQQDGIEATPLRLAERLGVSVEDVKQLAPILDHRAISLDVPLHGDEDGRTRGDALADGDAITPEAAAGGGEMQHLLQKAFGRFRATLDERDQAIWDDRLQSEDPLRLEDLGDRFGVSKERVRQLEVRIKKQLKTFLERELGEEVIIEALH